MPLVSYRRMINLSVHPLILGVGMRAAVISLCAWTLAVLLLMMPASSLAARSDSSITLLAGFNYDIVPDRFLSTTIEHVTIGDAGDIYLFVDAYHFDDRLRPGGRRTSFYSEANPRLSLGRALGLIDGNGLVKDVLLAGSYEEGQGRTNAGMVGLSVDLNIGRFVRLQLYRRNELTGRGFDAWHFSPAFSFPFKIADQEFLVDGFADVVWGGRAKADNEHINPQVKWNLLSGTGKRLWLGVELDWWTNKFGLQDRPGRDTDQIIACSLILKYHL